MPADPCRTLTLPEVYFQSKPRDGLVHARRLIRLPRRGVSTAAYNVRTNARVELPLLGMRRDGYAVLNCADGRRRLCGSHVLIAPLNAAVPYPEMRATPLLPPYGRVERGSASFVHLNAPARIGSGQRHQLDCGAASARAPQSDAPVLSVVLRENQITMWQRCRQSVAFDHAQSAGWTVVVPEPAQPSWDLHAATAWLWKTSNPSSGSVAPRPNTLLSLFWKLSSLR